MNKITRTETEISAARALADKLGETIEPSHPTCDDIGRVYTQVVGSQVSRTTPPVRRELTLDVVLVAVNPADDCECDVFVKPVMPDTAGEFPGRWVDFRSLTPTNERVEGTR